MQVVPAAPAALQHSSPAVATARLLCLADRHPLLQHATAAIQALQRKPGQQVCCQQDMATVRQHRMSPRAAAAQQREVLVRHSNSTPFTRYHYGSCTHSNNLSQVRRAATDTAGIIKPSTRLDHTWGTLQHPRTTQGSVSLNLAHPRMRGSVSTTAVLCPEKIPSLGLAHNSSGFCFFSLTISSHFFRITPPHLPLYTPCCSSNTLWPAT